MNQLTIYRLFFERADAYTSGTRQKQRGVQVHSTGANNPFLRRYVGPDDGRLGVNRAGNTHNRPGVSVCANAYIGKLEDGAVAVYQALPWDYRPWLSGRGPNGNANRQGFAGFEICEDRLFDQAYFEAAVMGASVLLTAHLCQLFGVEATAENVASHSELSARGLASNHSDIDHWLRVYGLKMDDYRAAVARAMKEGVNVNYVDAADAAQTPEPAAKWYGTVQTRTGNGINLWDTPAKGTSVAHVPDGQTVAVLTAEKSGFVRAAYNGRTGYADAAYLSDGAQAPEKNVNAMLIDVPQTAAESIIAKYPGSYILPDIGIPINTISEG